MTTLSRNARVAGLLYVTLMTAVLRLIYIQDNLIISGNAAATANNIAAHQTLFRLGILSDLFTVVMGIFLTLALYRLFKAVDQGLAAIMVILGAPMVTPIYFLNTINDAAALLLVRGTDFLAAFDKPQREAMAMLFLRLHNHGRRNPADHKSGGAGGKWHAQSASLPRKVAGGVGRGEITTCCASLLVSLS